jgi:hypothetical protein
MDEPGARTCIQAHAALVQDKVQEGGCGVAGTSRDFAGFGRSAGNLSLLAGVPHSARDLISARQCGACEFKEVCSGSRPRAYALRCEMLEKSITVPTSPKNWTGASHIQRHERVTLQVIA